MHGDTVKDVAEVRGGGDVQSFACDKQTAEGRCALATSLPAEEHPTEAHWEATMYVTRHLGQLGLTPRGSDTKDTRQRDAALSEKAVKGFLGT
jgi:hypothetical protein